jgi:hypothetical protein
MLTIPAALIQLNLPQKAQSSSVDNTTIWNHMSDSLHQSLYRVLSLLIAILPGILALVAALLIFTLIGMALSALLRRVLAAVKFDDRIARNHPDPGWAPTPSPAALVARAAFWGCLLLGLLIGVSAFDASFDMASALPISLLPYLAHVVGAIFLLIAGNLIARFLARSVLIGAVNAQLQYARFLSLGVKWLVLVLAAAMTLEHLEIGGVVVDLAFGILFGGIVLTLSLAVGLGSRELVSRSLESRVEHSGEGGAEPGATSPDESIRHF